MKNDSGLEQGCSIELGEKLLYSGYILKVKLIGVPGREKMGKKRKKGL